MPQTATRVLSVAALTIASAAGLAGTASAAPDPGQALNTATSALPVESAAQSLPVGGAEDLAAGQNALASGLSSAPPAMEAHPTPGDSAGGLLGGLPAKGLPVKGLPTG